MARAAAKAANDESYFDTSDAAISSAATSQIRSIVARVENIMEEIEASREDMKEIYAEAKGNGFDVKVLKALVKLKRGDKAKRQEFDALLDLYASAGGYDI